MASDFRVQGQYRASSESIRDFVAGTLAGTSDTPPGAAVIALSNLAVAEAIHQLRESIEARGQVNLKYEGLTMAQIQQLAQVGAT